MPVGRILTLDEATSAFGFVPYFSISFCFVCPRNGICTQTVGAVNLSFLCR